MPRSTKAPSTSPAIYQIKITLKWSQPPIWRRLLVRADTTLDRLHGAIQLAMDWENCHSHQFITGTKRDLTYYGEAGSDMLDEGRYTLADIAPTARSKFEYEYDFGDGWMHEIVTEKILPADPASQNPICLAGEGACPPEDCGGVPGYERMCEALANPTDAEHEEMKEWLGDDFDPAAFDLEKVNAQLKRYKG